MTTDKEALQKIFEAALRQADMEEMAAPAPPKPAPMRRMYCQTASPAAVLAPPLPFTVEEQEPPPIKRPVVERNTARVPLDAPITRRVVERAYASYTEPVVRTSDVAAPGQFSSPQEAAAGSALMDMGAADAIGALLDEKLAADTRKRRLNSLLTAAVVIAGLVAAAIWVYQNPGFLNRFSGIGKDLKAMSHLGNVAGDYQKSLNQVATHTNDVAAATSTLGDSSQPPTGEQARVIAEIRAEMGDTGTGQLPGTAHTDLGDSH